MTVYINGIVLQVTQPTALTRRDGTQVLDKNGVQMYAQTVTMQHEFQTQTGNGFNKYVTFDINANSTNKLISKLSIKQGEELEAALDIDSMQTQDGRWFNTIRCFAVERDKSKWHRPTIQRVAVMPQQTFQQNGVTQTPTYSQPAAQPAQQPAVAQPAQQAQTAFNPTADNLPF